MILLTEIISAIILINGLFAVITVLRQPRDIAATWAWLLVLILLPVVGFILYLFTGRGLSRKKIFQSQSQINDGVLALVDIQRQENRRNELLPKKVLSSEATEMVNLFLNINNAPVLKDNHVTLYTDGTEKFAALFADIKKATKSIHIEYYTIYNDQIGNELQALLVQKAREGVAVNVLYDAWGSQGATQKWWRPLEEAGGHAWTFFSSKHSITDFRLNFRDHRKIVVLDGTIGYIGGFNVGDQYLGRSAKFGNWRDTHMRITGNAVLALQVRFLMDWNASVEEAIRLTYSESHFPIAAEANRGTAAMQIVSSGPDKLDEQIKLGYLKMISSAKKKLWIQTPYLVPDDSIIDALTTAAMSGVDVRIMTPSMPDHPFIYRATQYYSQLLHEAGIKIYAYQDGFLHAKTVVMDGHISTIGSANMDIRSFKLNFEANAFIYDPKLARQLEQIYLEDIKNAVLLTDEMIAQQSAWLRFKQKFSRLLSPIL
ncbi:Cardiolipin synthase [Latilactobacillus sakei]|uniref:cardiolipin synthase n=1 Tax=Latilactobacillus sakei TaxID=1599 RepID=UPI000C134CAE|nr:cardiolipin synthase [Latilactobacillus sakei]MCM1635456.1 cardiolipin synthase [Latilactobacillus sakei]USF98238.1 cardiolipin synthase [Latilactobacillus sakei]SOB38313.1 Cardiolipin synthase [Latilactobacillus sakei]